MRTYASGRGEGYAEEEEIWRRLHPPQFACFTGDLLVQKYKY
jgi:hypothetical protein